MVHLMYLDKNALAFYRELICVLSREQERRLESWNGTGQKGIRVGMPVNIHRSSGWAAKGIVIRHVGGDIWAVRGLFGIAQFAASELRPRRGEGVRE